MTPKKKIFKAQARILGIKTGGASIIALGERFARDIDVYPMDRVRVEHNGRSTVASVDFWSAAATNEVGIFDEVAELLDLHHDDIVDIHPLGKPESTQYILKKMDGDELFQPEIQQIIADVVANRLNKVEIAAFITALYMQGTTLNETYYLTKSIAETGGTIPIEREIIADKHCSGGVPGNRTTMIVVPIITALGITMPKTSSRAITSAAGTADTMEVLAEVDFDRERFMKILDQANGCIVYGGKLNIASADDKMIHVRKPLGIDPESLLLASIMAKKYAMGATHIIFDLPVGEQGKFRHIGEVRHMEREFKHLGRKLGMNIDVLITDGNEPVGRGVGPVLEVHDVLNVLQQKGGPADLQEKSVMLAGKLIDLIGLERFTTDLSTGRELALDMLESGKAWRSMQSIIRAQGGNPTITAADFKPAKYSREIIAPRTGRIVNTNSQLLAKVARHAGAPSNKAAGIECHKIYSDIVQKDDVLSVVYAGSEEKMDWAFELLDEERLYEIY